jgi:hypothetical protein
MPPEVGYPSSETINTTTKERLIDEVIRRASPGWNWKKTTVTQVSVITPDGFMEKGWEVIARDEDAVLVCRLNVGNEKIIDFFDSTEAELRELNGKLDLKLLAPENDDEVIELTEAPEEVEAQRIKDFQVGNWIHAEILLAGNDGTWRLTDFPSMRVKRSNGRIEDNWEIVAIGSQGCFAWQYDKVHRAFLARKFISKEDAQAFNPQLDFPTDTEEQNPDPTIRWIRVGREEKMLKD